MDTKLAGPIELIKKSFDIFFEKNNLIYFFKIYAWLLPFQIFFLYQDYFISSQSKILNTENVYDVIFKYPWFLAAVILVNLIFLVVSFLVDVTGIKAIIGVVQGKINPAKQTFLSSWKILWPFSLVSILVGLVEAGGLILLIIPGIIFSIWFGFSRFIFIDKQTGVVESLKESKKLVEGKFWQILGRSFVFAVFIIFFQMVLSLIPYGIGSIIAQLFGALLVLPYFLLYKELSV